jgi:hypothetical protein
MMRDFKDYRASEDGGIGSKLAVFAGLICLLALLGWMGERDHAAKIEQVKAASCEVRL